MSKEKIREGRKPIPAGVGLIFGVAVGVVLFTILDNPVWIGLGAGLGILLGGGYGRLR
jgi:UDP-N-acetylmuramyl pentapeptide phosphotransferase/UDP-N-acetylglucosamine-1-phosphate transferase